MADAVAGVNILGVCLVLYVVLPQRGAVCLGIGTGQAETDKNILRAGGQDFWPAIFWGMIPPCGPGVCR